MDLLNDEGIGAHEILLLTPTPNGTQIGTGAQDEEIRHQMAHGLTAADVALPATYHLGSDLFST